jgi:hypothetical protein
MGITIGFGLQQMSFQDDLSGKRYGNRFTTMGLKK